VISRLCKAFTSNNFTNSAEFFDKIRTKQVTVPIGLQLYIEQNFPVPISGLDSQHHGQLHIGSATPDDVESAYDPNSDNSQDVAETIVLEAHNQILKQGVDEMQTIEQNVDQVSSSADAVMHRDEAGGEFHGQDIAGSSSALVDDEDDNESSIDGKENSDDAAGMDDKGFETTVEKSQKDNLGDDTLRF
jgi:hypothetical protein